MPFTWDSKALRFRSSDGRFIRREVVANALEASIAETKSRMLDVSQRLQRHEINLSQWVIEMRDLAKSQHTLAAGIARGGKAQMSPAEWGRVGQQTRQQYAYLAKFGRDVESGRQKLDGRFLQRAQMYASASRGTFAESERRMQRDAGVELARRELNAKESCQGCVEEAAKGWRPIDDVAPIGSRECRVNCACVLLFKRAA